MLNNNIKHLSNNKLAAASLFRKKFVVFFILACMSINGFIISFNDQNKYNLFMFFASVSKSAAVQLFDKCSKTLLAASNKVCIDILNIFFDFTAEIPAGGNAEQNKHENNCNDYAIIGVSAQIISKRIFNGESNDFLNLYEESIFRNKIFDFYGSGYTDHMRWLLIIYFILFIAIIRKRKILSLYININTNNMWKKRIST